MNNILMNTEMTKDILDDRKTQTRRLITSKIYNIKKNGYITYSDIKNFTSKTRTLEYFIDRYAKYKKDEVIWVREPAVVVDFSFNEVIEAEYLADGKRVIVNVKRFRNDNPKISNYPNWILLNQGIPNGCIKEMARIFLKITDVRVERLQDISKEDALKEISSGGWMCKALGMFQHYGDYTSGFKDKDYELHGKLKNGSVCSFRTIWNKTAQKGYKWEDNPYVFVYEFERVNRDGSKIK